MYPKTLIYTTVLYTKASYLSCSTKAALETLIIVSVVVPVLVRVIANIVLSPAKSSPKTAVGNEVTEDRIPVLSRGWVAVEESVMKPPDAGSQFRLRNEEGHKGNCPPINQTAKRVVCHHYRHEH